ncbi:MAG: M23 family metallopeptidase [Clostridia bacterium]|nr:M23 family metallopeptidase [Clostridia bacterium]
MWKKWKESKLYQKLKDVRVNRAVYLSAVVILLTLAVVLAITAANNQAKKDEVPDDVITDNNQAPSEPEKPDNTQPTVQDEPIPELALPVSGKLIKNHSVDVQVFSQTLKDWRVHLGVDIATAANAAVCSVADGTVAQIWEDPMMGWSVAVSHSGECMTVYKNLSKDLAEGITLGSTVKKGQLLGYVGDSAMLELAEDPHLHMEMTVKGLQVDPLDYFSAAVLKTLSEDTIYEEGSGK